MIKIEPINEELEKKILNEIETDCLLLLKDFKYSIGLDNISYLIKNLLTTINKEKNIRIIIAKEKETEFRRDIEIDLQTQ